MIFKILKLCKRVSFFFLSFVAVCIIFLVAKKFMPYEREYFGELGLVHTINPQSTSRIYSHMDAINSLGNPIKKYVTENGWIKLYYDGLTFSCLGINEKSDIANVIITSPQYKFGLYNIGIGSPKTLVDFAYKFSSARPSPDGDNIYLEDSLVVKYEYDTDNKVNKIQVCLYP